MKIKTFFSTVFVACALVSASPLAAQGDPGKDPDVKVPFDGGLSLLIAAGVSYGFKKAYDKRKRSNAAENSYEQPL